MSLKGLWRFRFECIKSSTCCLGCVCVVFEGVRFGPFRSLWLPLGSLLAPSDPLLGSWGCLWVTLGGLCLPFGSLWSSFGLPLVPFWLPLVPFGPPLVPLWSPLGCLGGVFGRPWAPCPKSRFRTSLKLSIWAPFWYLFGESEGSSNDPFETK